MAEAKGKTATQIMEEAMAYSEIASQLMVIAALQVNQQGKMLFPFTLKDGPLSSVAHTIAYRVVVPPKEPGKEQEPAFLERVIDIALLKANMKNRASMLELDDEGTGESVPEEDDEPGVLPPHSIEARAYAEDSARNAGKDQVCWQVGRNTPPDRMAEFLDHLGHDLFDLWPLAIDTACREDLGYLLKPLRHARQSTNVAAAVKKAMTPQSRPLPD